MSHAVVHTKGVLLSHIYIPLELAYYDVTGKTEHIFIASPISYSTMMKLFPTARPDVLVTTRAGASYSKVLDFLKERRRYLQEVFQDSEIVFGYKGELFQSNILKDAKISNIVNVEKFGVPKLRRDHAPDDGSPSCPLHHGHRNKCAVTALKEILSTFWLQYLMRRILRRSPRFKDYFLFARVAQREPFEFSAGEPSEEA